MYRRCRWSSMRANRLAFSPAASASTFMWVPSPSVGPDPTASPCRPPTSLSFPTLALVGGRPERKTSPVGCALPFDRKEAAMFVRMTLTEDVPDLDAAVAHLRDEVLPALKDLNGFR